MRRRVLLSMTLISMSACRGDDATRPILDPASPPSHSISDGNNNRGNPEFFLLPPLVKNPSGSTEWSPGTFNGSLAPTVDICELAAATDAEVVTTTPCKAGGYASKHQLTSANVSLTDEHYHMNWGVPSSAAVFFRISVSVGSVALGFVDLKTGSSSDLKNVNTGELVPMKDGRTLPIKFRIEKYALCENPSDRDKPCTSKSIDFGEGGTVTDGEAEPSGIDVPAQPGGAVHTITLVDCANLNPRATDLPTFDECLRVTVDPALTAPLTNAATVFNCAVSGTVGGEYGTPQARLLAMLQLNEQVTPQRVKALPHADPTCPTSTASVAPSFRGAIAALAHGRVTSAAKQLLAVLAPRPLYAARFIDLGGGGFTHFDNDGGQGGLNSVGSTGGARLSVSAAAAATTIRDFQLALPAKFEVSATPTDRSELVGSTITVSVKVTDLDGEPVPNARVRFEPSAGSSVDAAVFEPTGTDGMATVQWTLSDAAGVNTLVASGRGIAGPDANGPREGTDPFQPLHTEWGDGTDATAPVVVSTGSMTVTATGRAREIVVFNDINLFDDVALADDNNQRLVRNLFDFTGTGPRSGGTVVVMESGHGGLANCFGPQAQQEITGLGYTVSSLSSAVIIDQPSNVRALILCLPHSAYSRGEINAMKRFVAQGGQIIFVGEWSSFYGTTGIATENRFLTDMGAGLRNIGQAIDCGRVVLPSTSLGSHPLMTGLTQLSMACASVVTLGAGDVALFVDRTRTKVLGAVAKVSVVPLPPALMANAAHEEPATWVPTLDPIGDPAP